MLSNAKERYGRIKNDVELQCMLAGCCVMSSTTWALRFIGHTSVTSNNEKKWCLTDSIWVTTRREIQITPIRIQGDGNITQYSSFCSIKNIKAFMSLNVLWVSLFWGCMQNLLSKHISEITEAQVHSHATWHKIQVLEYPKFVWGLVPLLGVAPA